MKTIVPNGTEAGLSRSLSAAMIAGLVLFALLSGVLSLGVSYYLMVSLAGVAESSWHWGVTWLGFWSIISSGYISGLCVKVFYNNVVFGRLSRFEQVTDFPPDFTNYCLFTIQLLFTVTPILLLILFVYSPLAVLLQKESLSTFPWAALAETVAYALVLWGVVITWAHNWVVKTVENSHYH